MGAARRCCDNEVKSILHAATRELFEEAGLVAKKIEGPVGDPHFFEISGGRRVCQFDLAVHLMGMDFLRGTVRLRLS